MDTVTWDMRTLNEIDHARLTKLLPADAAGLLLADLLDNAHLLAPDAVPATLVTLNAKVRLDDDSGGRDLTLCYPRDADPAAGRVSVLSPLGQAVLGLSVGDELHWNTPQGTERSARVVGILYQPEAAGEYLL